MDLHGDGRQVRTFTYVSDTVDGYIRALDTPDAQGEILNIGGDEPITMIRLATAVLIIGRLIDYRNRWSPVPA